MYTAYRYNEYILSKLDFKFKCDIFLWFTRIYCGLLLSNKCELYNE